MALSAAPNRRKSETLLATLPGAGGAVRSSAAPRRRRRATRGASCSWTCGLGVPGFRRFRAAERA
eukprot:9847594-Alexandrium_andersonii.AAC.1